MSAGHVSESLYSLKLLLPQHVFLTNKIKLNYLNIGLLMYYDDKKKRTVLTYVFARVFYGRGTSPLTLKTTNGCRKN